MARTTTTRTATTGGTLEAMAAAAVADFEHVLARMSHSEATRLRRRFESWTLRGGPRTVDRSGPATILSVARGLTREAKRQLAQATSHDVATIAQGRDNEMLTALARDPELLALTERPGPAQNDDDAEDGDDEPPRRARTARVRQGDVEADLPIDDAFAWRDNAGLRARYGGSLATFAKARNITARRVQRPAGSRAAAKLQAAKKPAKKPMRPAARVEREPPMTADERATHDAAVWTERIVGRWEGSAKLRESFGGSFQLYLTHLELEASGTVQPLGTFDARAAVAALGGSLAGIEEPLTPEQEAAAYQAGVTRARRDDRWERDADLRATFGGCRELWEAEQNFNAEREQLAARRPQTSNA